MPRIKRTPNVELKITQTPLPPNRVPAWLEGARLLLDLLRERRNHRPPCLAEVDTNNEPSSTVKEDGSLREKA